MTARFVAPHRVLLGLPILVLLVLPLLAASVAVAATEDVAHAPADEALQTVPEGVYLTAREAWIVETGGLVVPEGVNAPNAPNTPGTLWANGAHDFVNAFASEDSDRPIKVRAANDFELGPQDPACQEFVLTEVRASLLVNAEPSGHKDAEIEIWSESGGGGPSANANEDDADLYDGIITNTYVNLGQNFGRDIREFSWDLTGQNVVLPPGTFWLVAMGVSPNASPLGQSFWTSASPVQLDQNWFRSVFFGFPSWVPGNTVFGITSDAAFDIDGECAGGAPVGGFGVGEVEMAGEPAAVGTTSGRNSAPFALAVVLLVLGAAAVYMRQRTA